MTTFPYFPPTRSWQSAVAILAVLVFFALTPEMAAQSQYPDASGTTQVRPPVAASPQVAAAAPPLGGVNITVNTADNRAQNETSIAVNTSNSSNLIGGANDYRNGPSACGRYRSTNGGASWTDLAPFAMFTDPTSSPLTAYTDAGDPGVAFDANGHAYYLCMFFTRDGSGNAVGPTQYVYKSDDGGATWGTPFKVSGAAAHSNFDDKGHIAVDNKSFTANRGNIYVAWARLSDADPHIHFARSTNGGVSFDNEINGVAGLGGSGANIAVGIDGTVYLASVNVNTISIASSTDGGLTFAAATTVRTFAVGNIGGGVRPLARTNSFPVLGTSSSDANHVYAVWAEQAASPDDSDIMFARSTDKGATWSAPVRVNDDINPSPTDWNSQFFPWIAVDPTDGSINIVWYDNRLDPNHTDNTPLVDLFFASSTDDGLSFSVNTRISTTSSDTTPNFGGTGSPTAGQFFGDYNGIAAFGGVAYPLWTDSRTGDQEVMTTQVGGADLAITKTTSSATANAGTPLTFTIGVTNNGPASAFNVVVTDTLPVGLSFVSSTNTCTAVAGTVTCNLGSIAPGGSTSFDIQGAVGSAVASGTTLTNTATVKSDQQDPVASNNTATASVIVTAQADLQVAKVCKPDSLAPAGTSAFCTITVTDNGPSDAQNVTLNDSIVANNAFQITSVTSSLGTCSFAPGTVTSNNVACTLGTLAAGTSASITVNFTSSSASDVNDTATASSSTPDPNTANNSATGHVSFTASADLSITKVASANSGSCPFCAGTNLTYTITASNAGPSTATGVVVKDTIPAQVAVLSVTPSAGSCTAGIPGNPLQPLTCTVGNLVPSGSVTITVVAAISSSVPNGTVINNNASVSSNVADPNTGNNSATAAVTVVTNADLIIVKSSDKSIYKPSSQVTYTVTVTNNGPSDALAVVVTDNLPSIKQASFKSDTGGCTKNATPPTKLVCNLGTIPFGTSRSFNIYELINGNQGSVSNTASVSSPTTDPNLSNNMSTRTVTIGH
jgi:uncharacterized repeat protein (TIGR01451 family)